MFRTQNLCPGSRNVFDSMAKTFFVSEQQNLFPQHMFPERLNWETFASATMFPSLARPLQSFVSPPGRLTANQFATTIFIFMVYGRKLFLVAN